MWEDIKKIFAERFPERLSSPFISTLLLTLAITNYDLVLMFFSGHTWNEKTLYISEIVNRTELLGDYRTKYPLYITLFYVILWPAIDIFFFAWGKRCESAFNWVQSRIKKVKVVNALQLEKERDQWAEIIAEKKDDVEKLELQLNQLNAELKTLRKADDQQQSEIARLRRQFVSQKEENKFEENLNKNKTSASQEHVLDESTSDQPESFIQAKESNSNENSVLMSFNQNDLLDGKNISDISFFKELRRSVVNNGEAELAIEEGEKLVIKYDANSMGISDLSRRLGLAVDEIQKWVKDSDKEDFAALNKSTPFLLKFILYMINRHNYKTTSLVDLLQSCKFYLSQIDYPLFKQIITALILFDGIEIEEGDIAILGSTGKKYISYLSNKEELYYYDTERLSLFAPSIAQSPYSWIIMELAIGLAMNNSGLEYSTIKEHFMDNLMTTDHESSQRVINESIRLGFITSEEDDTYAPTQKSYSLRDRIKFDLLPEQ